VRRMTGVGLGEVAGTWERRICWRGRLAYEAGSEAIGMP
jgi:hypothetical protein